MKFLYILIVASSITLLGLFLGAPSYASYANPTPTTIMTHPITVQEAPHATTLPSTGSPLSETLSLFMLLPIGLIVKKLTILPY